MRVRHLYISNFRGIKLLEHGFAADQRTICLIGSGDAGKTTILNAIELGLSPRWNPSISDSDFMGGEPSAPIEIRVTVGELPESFSRPDRFGLKLRGVSKSGELHDDPAEQDEHVLTVRLTIDRDLEPKWHVWKESTGADAEITAGQRERLGAVRFGLEAARHVNMGRGSALARMVGDLGGASVVVEARRGARETTLKSQDGPTLDAAEKAAKAIAALGGTELSEPRIALIPYGGRATADLGLHDSGVPLATLGYGSARLAALAIELGSADGSSVVLLDEVESGLEPHRLGHLLQKLKSAELADTGQRIFTTHSPQVVEELDCADLLVVRRVGDQVKLVRVPADLDTVKDAHFQRTVRAAPSSLLARKVIVCEGATEVGLIRGLSRYWANDAKFSGSLVLGGVAFVDGGGGPDAPTRARCLEQIGIATLIWADDDLTGEQKTAFDESIAEAQSVGAKVVLCSPGSAIEDEIVSSFCDEKLVELVDFVVDDLAIDTESAIHQSLASAVDSDPAMFSGRDPVQWAAGAAVELSEMRTAIANRASKKRWFKNESRAEALMTAICSTSHPLGPEPDSHLVEMVREIRHFSAED